MAKRTRLLLVDDQTLFVQNLKTVLDMAAGDLEVVAIAYSGREALKILDEREVDIVLMDVRMADIDGVQAAGMALKKYPSLKVIMLTTFDDDDYVYQALRLGASGYILKDISAEELVSAVYAVRDGTVLVSPSIARKLVLKKKLMNGKKEDEESGGIQLDWWNSLSRREREVLLLAAEGWSNEVIAEKLFISRYTVRNSLSVIYSKLGISSRTELKRLVERDKRELKSLLGE